MACSLVSSGSAQAQCGLNQGAFGAYGGGYGAFDVGRLYGVLAQNVPYFAAFPPVYYSAPVPRTYGYSPFAYPPGVRTPDLPAVVIAQEILNPYVPVSTPPVSTESESLESEKIDQVTQAIEVPQPLVIVNPYVTTRLAGHTGR
ncbi:MAG: hypothetical protein GXP28_04840 [Planctomycetes bacterium]|nr:hypothetical protein [Planctomycetota bacterium]